jgi:hypothetical protein
MRSFLARVLILLAATLGPALAHDIPEEIVLHGFVKPEGDRLHFVVRVPTVMLLSMNLPKRGPGYLDLAQIDEPMLQAAAAATAKEIELFENGLLLKPGRTAARISRGADRSFEAYASARSNIEGPKLQESAEVFWNQGYFDAHVEYPITSDRSDFSLEMQLAPGLAKRLKLVVRFMPPDGAVRAYQLAGDAGHVILDPRWHQAAWAFVKFGFLHILDGIDHLLFLLCLVIPFRRIGWTLVGVITSFTVAHSVTLIAAAYGLVPSAAWFPPLIEALIAVSILYMAIENVLRPNLQRRWLVTFAFGLVHGFGFSFLLQSQLQFAGSHLLTSLLAFNVGIELGQLLVLAILVPLIALSFNWIRSGEKTLTLILSLVIGHTAWHWTVERGQALRDVEWPALASWLGPAGLALALLGIVGGLTSFFRQRPGSRAPTRALAAGAENKEARP